MAIMIRVAELMAECFWFLWEFVGFLYFLDCSPSFLGGFTWRLQKKPPISNSKMDNVLSFAPNEFEPKYFYYAFENPQDLQVDALPKCRKSVFTSFFLDVSPRQTIDI